MMELENGQPSIERRPNFFVRLLRLLRKLIVFALLLVLIFAAFESTFFWEFSAKLFHGIDTVHSQYDVDNDGIDDFTDIMLAARRYIRTKPTYDASWSNGYPPADRGVCTDVIWYALGSAGYDFKALIDQDIRQNPNLYPDRANGSSKIDFRRVANLRVFFERHTQKLTTDVMQVEQAGAKREEGVLKTNGGRVLGVTATAADLKSAIATAYERVETIHFDNAFYRRDIGARAMKALEN